MELNNKGSSLLELMLVIFILSILISIPRLTSSKIGSFKEDIKINRLVDDVIYTKNEAIFDMKKKMLKFNLVSNTYEIKDSSLDSRPIKTVDLGPELSLRSDGNLQTLILSESGAPLKGGTVVIQGNTSNDIYRISFTPVTGRINIKRE